MEDPRWVRIIAVGLVLAALAIGYFLLSGSFVKTKPKSEVLNKVVVETPVAATPKPATASAYVPTRREESSAYTRILNRTQAQSGVTTLPRTGFPAALVAVFSVSAVISGWGLRKFPH